MKKLFYCLLFFFSLHLSAQDTGERMNRNDVEMADTFRQEGKIYVVVLTIGIILTGIIIYLILLDRKLKRLENEINSDNNLNV